ncbi:MAG: hypothetical protein JKX87_05835 [Cycloclasticus sp.]|nr:hypothetical protein [Cycloclasticus sp.]
MLIECLKKVMELLISVWVSWQELDIRGEAAALGVPATSLNGDVDWTDSVVAVRAQ